jgi:hypothetical protein
MPRTYVSTSQIAAARAALGAMPAPPQGRRRSPYIAVFAIHFADVHRDHMQGDTWATIIQRYFRKPFPSKRTIQRLYRQILGHAAFNAAEESSEAA